MKGFFKSRLVLTLVTLILPAAALAVSLAGITHLAHELRNVYDFPSS